MQFVITASAASLLLAYLNLYYKVPVNSFIINLVGKSTTGKSTAQELGASMMSSLDDTKVISPFFGTQNAVLKALTGKIGICSHYDESTCISSFNKEGSNICNLTERLVNQYSVILVTGELLEEFGLQVDTEKIADIMLEHHKVVTKSTDIAKNAYEVLMNYISRNPYNLRIKIIEKNQEIAIVESLFREILNKGGYRDIKTVVDELDAKRYTKRREKNRKKVKLSVNGNQCYCYLLDAAKFGESDIIEPEKSIKIQEGEEYDFNPDEEDEI